MWTLYLHVCLHAGSFMPLMFCINSRRFVSVRKFNYSQAQIQFTWSVLFVYLRYDFRVMSIDWHSSGLLYTNSFPTCVSHNALRDFLGAFTGNKVCFVRPSTGSFTDSINYLWRSALIFFASTAHINDTQCLRSTIFHSLCFMKEFVHPSWWWIFDSELWLPRKQIEMNVKSRTATSESTHYSNIKMQFFASAKQNSKMQIQ